MASGISPWPPFGRTHCQPHNLERQEIGRGKFPPNIERILHPCPSPPWAVVGELRRRRWRWGNRQLRFYPDRHHACRNLDHPDQRHSEWNNYTERPPNPIMVRIRHGFRPDNIYKFPQARCGKRTNQSGHEHDLEWFDVGHDLLFPVLRREQQGDLQRPGYRFHYVFSG